MTFKIAPLFLCPEKKFYALQYIVFYHVSIFTQIDH